MILWHFVEPRNHCSLHGSFETKKGEGKSTKCPDCEKLPEKERATQKVKRTEDPVRKTAPIYDFVTEFEKFINTKWRKHTFQKRGLNQKCKQYRRAEELLLKAGHEKDVIMIRDYTDRVKCAYDRETQTGGMGGSQKNIGMEGILYAIYNRDSKKVEWHWQGYLSDEKIQDARTSFANTRKFVEMMQKKGYLTKGATLWVQSDGCAKQYKCGTAVYSYSALATIYTLKIDVFITTAGHGKCLVDALAGTDKAYLGTGFLKGMDPSRIDEFGKTVSEAEKACIYLSDPRRPLGDSKHKKREDDTHISSRKYEVSNYDTEKDIQLKTCAWTVDGFEVGSNNGISEMHHFRYHYKLPMGTVAIRRVPCMCDACLQQL